MPRPTKLFSIGAIALLAAGASLAIAAAPPPTPAPPPPAAPPAPPPAAAPATPPTSAPPSGIPDLDDLLGIPRRGAGDIPDPAQADLERRLTGQEIGDAFKEAVTLMGQAAQRLGAADAQRAGIGTQRIQEDAVRKLDQLIAQLEQMSSSSSKSKSSSPGTPDQSRSQPQQQQASSSESQNQGENNSENEPPARRDGPLRPELDSTRASWGALPARVRDMLLQGSSDQFSSMYEKMTESYYRRLAEERRPQ